MGTVHQLITKHGRQGTIALGTLDREIIEAAAKYMGDEDSGLGFIYSGWAQCALPHRRLANDEPWQMASERVRLIIQPGLRPVGDEGGLESVGVPFGAMPTRSSTLGVRKLCAALPNTENTGLKRCSKPK